MSPANINNNKNKKATTVYMVCACSLTACGIKTGQVIITLYHIDSTLRALWLVNNPCFIRVQNIEEECFIVLRYEEA